ncbi:unnamed protein product [Toxocara canis]|uniref:Uncharacterized protein n=1 Tax=Toxocara canis TaxID=6265 RepID=A0A183U6H5_TOXCA|nr:unnamed protein product [Toxocara canis]
MDGEQSEYDGGKHTVCPGSSSNGLTNTSNGRLLLDESVRCSRSEPNTLIRVLQKLLVYP